MMDDAPMLASANAAPLLSMRGISKAFPGVQALRDVDLELFPGEVLALLGENGAGKSTLVKVLSGAHAPDTGTIRIGGADPKISDPAAAKRAGVGVIYQEFNLVPALSARENIFLGQERTTAGFLHRRAEHRHARQLFDRMGVTIDPETPCRRLSIAAQQVVEIARALSLEARIIVMDEPSATLTPREVERLFDVVRELRSQGIGIIYISHRLEEIFAIADRVCVLRDGAHVHTLPVADVNRDRLIEMMVGRRLENEFPRETRRPGDVRLVVEDLRGSSSGHGVSFSACGGEILAVTGLVGAGRTEMVRLIFGADVAHSGSMTLDGKSLEIRSPRDAIRAGLCLLTEDRKLEGLVLGHSARDNFGLPSLSRLSRFGFVRRRQERDEFAGYVDSLRIKISSQEQRVDNLSGGNQQKVVLARWLARRSEVIIFDEPTRGIDVGAKYEIYSLMNELAGEGKVVIMVSSELPEVLGMADRVLVMHEGRITGEITDVKDTTQEEIMELAIG